MWRQIVISFCLLFFLCCFLDVFDRVCTIGSGGLHLGKQDARRRSRRSRGQPSPVMHGGGSQGSCWVLRSFGRLPERMPTEAGRTVPWPSGCRFGCVLHRRRGVRPRPSRHSEGCKQREACERHGKPRRDVPGLSRPLGGCSCVAYLSSNSLFHEVV